MSTIDKELLFVRLSVRKCHVCDHLWEHGPEPRGKEGRRREFASRGFVPHANEN